MHLPRTTQALNSTQGSNNGQCTRENCRYLHPPPHLKTQLEIKGQNNIAARRMLQNAHLQNQLLAQQGSAIPLQPTLLSTVPTTLQSGVGTTPSYITSPIAAATSQANAEANAAAYYGQYVIPVAVSMAPTVSHSSLSQHMYPGSYLSQAMQTALPTVQSSQAVPGSINSTAHPGFSEIPLQTSIIPNAPGGPSFQFLPLKAKNDRLELPTNRKRQREEDDLLLMWNYFKDDSSRWPSSPEYSNYLQNHHQGLTACFPRPPKVQAGMIPQPQLAQPPIYPSNFMYNPLAPMVMTQPQFLPTSLPMMPTPFPLMAPHFLHNPNTSETLPVCRDFKSGNCKRPNCKYAHVVEDYVEITDGKVTVCRYAVQNRCTRPRCKFYHPPTTSVAVVNSLPSMPTPGVTNA